MIGATLNERYTIASRLGAGAMGVVYRARDTRLDRDVAVKMMGDHLADDEQSAQRFIREAQLAAGLDHENIGRVYDFGRDASGRLYLVMPLLEGSAVSDLIRDGQPLPVVDALSAVADAAAGLSHAHRAGIIHRDIKPGNLFRTDRGRLSILDFGLARLANGPGDPTAFAGTWAYMAPEQFDPAYGPVGPAADIYGLTGVLLHAVTGRRPFPDVDWFPQALAAHTLAPRPVPSDIDPRFGWLDTVVARGMAIAQDARPVSAESMVAHAIHSWLASAADHEVAALDRATDSVRALRSYDENVQGRWLKVVTDMGSDTRGRVFLIELKPDGIAVEREVFAENDGFSWPGTWYSGTANDGRSTVEITVDNKYFGTVHRINKGLFVGTESGPQWIDGAEAKTTVVNARVALVRLNTEGTGPHGTLR